MCGVAGEQHPSLAVGRRLPGHVGEPGDPGRAVHPVVGPVDGDERLAEIVAGWARRLGPTLRFGQHDPYRPPSSSLADAMTPTVAADARTPAPRRPSRPRRSASWSSDPTRGTRCRPPFGSDCVLRRIRRGSPPVATGRRTARRRRRCRPARSPSPHVRERSAPPAR